MVKVLHDAGIAVKLPWVLQELLDRFSDSYMYGSSEWIDAPFAVHCVLRVPSPRAPLMQPSTRRCLVVLHEVIGLDHPNVSA